LRITAVIALATTLTECRADPDGAQPFAVSGLDEKRDYGTHNEYRFESFSEDDDERLPEHRYGTFVSSMCERHRARQCVCDRVASTSRRTRITAAHGDSELAEQAFQQ
jgi:hypothetical protein